jgi:hypothetical protein
LEKEDFFFKILEARLCFSLGNFKGKVLQSNAFGKGKFVKSKVKRRFRQKLKNFLFQKCVSKTEEKRILGRAFGKGSIFFKNIESEALILLT